MHFWKKRLWTTLTICKDFRRRRCKFTEMKRKRINTDHGLQTRAISLHEMLQRGGGKAGRMSDSHPVQNEFITVRLYAR